MSPADGGPPGRLGGMDPRNRRAAIAAGVALAALVVYLLVTLTGGGGGSPAAAPRSSATTAAPSGGAIRTTAGGAGASATTAPLNRAKDPFRSPAGTTGSTGSGTSTTGGGGGGTAGGPGGGVSTSTTAHAGPDHVELIDVYPAKGTTYSSVQVNSVVYSVTSGQTFDANYRAVDLSVGSGCGDFTYRGKAFHLCKGQQAVEQQQS